MDKTKIAIKEILISSICLLSVFYTSCSKSGNQAETTFLPIETLVWDNPDSVLSVLEDMDTVGMCQNLHIRWQFLHMHALVRSSGYVGFCDTELFSDSVIDEIISHYINTKQYKHLGEALYLKGIKKYIQTDYSGATKYLKQAEDYISYMQGAEQYVGMIYYMLAGCSESNTLYQIAMEYEKQALPYFRMTNDHVHLSACYRDIATHSFSADHNDTTYYHLFDSALYEAELAKSPILYMSALYHKQESSTQIDSLALYETCKYLCDSLQCAGYAWYLVEYLIEHNSSKEAEKYLEIFATDTIYRTWSAQTYRYCHSKLLRYQNQPERAYDELIQMYGERVEQLCNDANSRTYAITRLYDTEKERAERLRLQTEKQQLWLLIVGIITVFVIIMAVISLYVQRQRHHAAEEEQVAALRIAEANAEKQRALRETEVHRKEVEMMKQELKHQQEQLRLFLKTRLCITREIRIALERSDKDYFTANIKNILHELAVMDKETWDEVMVQFNSLYNNKLQILKDKHNGLRRGECRLLMLVTLGFDASDIAHLLSINKESVYKGIHRLREHLVDDEHEIPSKIISENEE